MNLAAVALVALIASIAASGLLAAGVWALARLRPLDARTRHALWFGALVAIALLPVAGVAFSLAHAQRVPAPPVSAASIAHLAAPLQPAAGHAAGSSGAPATAASPTPARAFPASLPGGIAALVLAILAAGAAFGLGGLLLSLGRVRAVKRRSSPLDDTLSHDLPWLTAPGARRETYLRLSYEIETPVAIGFRRPVILIPTDLATEHGLRAIEDLVVHEHAHLDRFDDYTNLVQRFVERVFWFNPFVWVAGKQIALQREIAADDAVVARSQDSASYAESLWRLAREMRMPAHTIVAPGALFDRKQISTRIEALLAPGRNRLHGLGPAGAAIAFGLAIASFAVVAIAAPPLQLPAQDRLAAAPAPPPDAPHAAPLAAPLAAAKIAPLAAPQAAPSVAAAPAIAAERLNVARLEAEAKSLKAALAAKRAAQTHVTVPDVRVDVPATHIDVPGAQVTIPKIAFHFDPAGAAAGAGAGADGGTKDKRVAANFDAAADPQTTRELLSKCTGCDLSGRNFAGADLHGIAMTGVDFSRADLRNANLSGADLTGADLSGANLDGANLTNAKITGADISGATFRGAHLDGVAFTGISLREARFDQNGLRLLLMHGCNGCDLSRMDLRGIDLHGVQLSGTDLAHSDLSGANLSGAKLTGVSFDGAHLDHADLRNAVLTGCSLDGASFNGVQLDGIRLVGTNIDVR